MAAHRRAQAPRQQERRDGKVFVMGSRHAQRRGMRRKDRFGFGQRSRRGPVRWRGVPAFGYTDLFGESGCESGGIGRRTGFRFQRGRPWGFESPLSHQPGQSSKDFDAHANQSGNASAQLERRLNVAVPRRADRERGREAPGAARQERQDSRLPAGQGAAEDGRAAIRPAGALRRHRRHGAGDASPTRSATRTCASPAIRASSRRRASRRRRPVRVHGGVRGLSRDPDRRPVAGDDRRGRWPRSAPADVDDTIEVLRKQRTTLRAGRRGRRPTGDRVIVDFSGRIDGVEFAGGQAKDFAIVARRGPDAARVRGGGDRHAGRRDQGRSR